MAEVNIRGLALDTVCAVLEDGEYSDRYLSKVLTKYHFLEKRDRAFLTRLSLGTIEQTMLLDAIIENFSDTKIKKMKPVIRNVLRISVFQIYFMDRVPDSAIVNEAVKLTKKRGLAGLSGFVNGVLRAILRQKKPIGDFDFPLSLRCSLPDWIVDMWEQDYGEDQTKQIAESFLLQKGMAVRTNLLKTTPEDLQKTLENEGVTVQKTDLPDAFFLSGVDDIEELSSFRDGLFYIMDLSSMQVVRHAGITAGMRILDVCAAPGGKSLYAAEQLCLAEQKEKDAQDAQRKEQNAHPAERKEQNAHPVEQKEKDAHSTEPKEQNAQAAQPQPGFVTARDISGDKIKKIDENIRRWGLSNIKTGQRDALCFVPEDEGAYDLVIADLPCSGLGVIGHKPEIKYRMTKEQTIELAKLQRDILDVVCRYVKEGGRLLYSTCTIDEEENTKNRKLFLSDHPEFVLTDEEQILPKDGLYDGFYIAVMEKGKGL